MSGGTHLPRKKCPGGHFILYPGGHFILCPGGHIYDTEIKTSADAVARARLLMMVLHQASVSTVASVNVGIDSQTAAIDTLQDHVRHLTEQMPSLVDRLDGLSVAAVARSQSSDGRSIIRCFKCHRTGPISRNCRQQQVTCYSCGRPGHIARVCRQQPQENGIRMAVRAPSHPDRFLKPQEYITAATTDKVTIVNGKLEGNDV